MCVISIVTVTVPATTANLGPGFDCLGAALTLYNQFKFTRLDSTSPSTALLTNGGSGGVRIIATGAEAERVSTSSNNLIYQSFIKLYEYLGQTPPPVQIEINMSVPLARGLGSSATAIVGGVVGANQLAGQPLSQNELMSIAIALEGHPDNVVPALLGGCRLVATGITGNATVPQDSQKAPLNQAAVELGSGWEICDIPWHPDIVPVVAIPDFELSTSEARQVLPGKYSREAAIFNTAHLGLLLRGLETGREDWLQAALQDQIHQPYRQALIPGYEAVKSAALAAGALGMVISGAGPTLLALVKSAKAAVVEAAMVSAWRKEGVTSEVRSLQIDSTGAKSITELKSK